MGVCGRSARVYRWQGTKIPCLLRDRSADGAASVCSFMRGFAVLGAGCGGDGWPCEGH